MKKGGKDYYKITSIPEQMVGYGFWNMHRNWVDS